MDSLKLIEKVVNQAKGLTDEEKENCLVEQNIPYLNERIAYHKKMSGRQTLMIILLSIFAVVSIAVLLANNYFEPVTMSWIKGVLTGYFAAMVVLMPKSFKSHSRIANTLTFIKLLSDKGKEEKAS
ncbi:MAG: hypothetical protein H6537_10125 [Bacteroidales bacterium]|nr:hypothetical protein [Bacteroidales bacterium]HPD96103.1 hypothetical protein [Tenuifilaceae bacterium]HRX31398.1 hypothetical protein [Tenuifilaceae bacterium]